jgi:palmitoyl-protein thioesterase
MYAFADDTMLLPRESSHFGYWDKDRSVVSLENQTLYQNDWLGLKTLNEDGRLIKATLPGNHVCCRVTISV